MKNNDLIKYAGLALAGVFLLPKLLKGSGGADFTENAPMADPNYSSKFEISSIQVSAESQTDKGGKVTLYVTIKNPNSKDETIDSVSGSLFSGPIQFATLNVPGPKVIEANGTLTIPVVFIMQFSTLPTPLYNKIQTNKTTFAGLLTGAYFKGNIVVNKVKIPSQVPLSSLDLSKITGVPINGIGKVCRLSV